MSATMEMPAAGEAAAGGRQFVTFRVQDELFGVPLAEVQEIIRMPELVQVPLSPPSLEGIANLRGAVLPITSLRRVFGTSHAAHDDATRVVVVNPGGTPVGFVVDQMASVITAEAEEIEGAEAMEATVRSDLLRGVVKRTSGMIMLLDPARLAAVEVRAAERRGGTAGLSDGAAEPGERGGTGAATVDEIQLVSFEAAGQEYAFPIDDVQEIVQVPERITRVPQAQPHVVGVMTLRDRLLPLVSLRRMFALPERAEDEHSRIVVVSLGTGAAASVGIVMDTVKEVLRVNRALTDPVPALLASGEEQSEFEAICRLEGGKRLVTILSAARMFRDAALRAAIAAAAETGGQEEVMAEGDEGGRRSTAAGADDEEQFVVFRLAGEEYGVPIDMVQEIVRVPEELTRVPKAAVFMEGVVNLRGTVLPVVDQRRRFALEEAERNDRQRIMVLTIRGVRTGFIVDQVSEVLKIARSAIERAPALSEEQARLIRRVANLEAQKRMILLLDPTHLLEAQEIEALEAL
ncbi:chemotaxis protein CheW [Roseicella aquatilis]|uniref:Chemotaxis protein CheW n=1 Tax=Roseicella aquatilis TaxID=2527868 RepID=A0A4R4DV47_9PROT|nr:chemotaxis protein CheW [Roseicella aquatilis]TCZ64994.1 chemotaxis protein CheW [Roseicella aquatilis]